MINFDRGLEDPAKMLIGMSDIEIRKIWIIISVLSVQRERLWSGMKEASSSMVLSRVIVLIIELNSKDLPNTN